MTIARHLAPYALAAALIVPAAAPASAQSQPPGLETIFQVLTDVIRHQMDQDEVETAARRELDDRLYEIQRERDWVIEDFERRRWEEKRRYEDAIADIRGDSWWKGDRKRQMRAVRLEHEDRLRHLDTQEQRRLAELDRRAREAERRYEDELRYGDAGPRYSRDYDRDYRDYGDYRYGDWRYGDRGRVGPVVVGRGQDRFADLPQGIPQDLTKILGVALPR